MNKEVLVEGILILSLSLLSIGEAVHLLVFQYADRHTLYDPVGPGLYILAVSILLLATGILHIVKNYRRVIAEKVITDKQMKKRMIYMIGGFAIYIFIIDIVGYLIGTLIFFFLEFRAVGIKSLKTNVALTLIITASYYFVFLKFCDMVFPRGIFFR